MKKVSFTVCDQLNSKNWSKRSNLNNSLEWFNKEWSSEAEQRIFIANFCVFWTIPLQTLLWILVKLKVLGSFINWDEKSE